MYCHSRDSNSDSKQQFVAADAQKRQSIMKDIQNLHSKQPNLANPANTDKVVNEDDPEDVGLLELDSGVQGLSSSLSAAQSASSNLWNAVFSVCEARKHYPLFFTLDSGDNGLVECPLWRSQQCQHKFGG